MPYDLRTRGYRPNPQRGADMPDDRPTPPLFPAVRSLLAPDALAERVARAYGLDDARCRLIKATIRDVYRVDARQGPSVLIVYRHDRWTADAIESELDVLDDLAARGPAAGVAVAPALRTVTGQRLLALRAPEGTRHAVRFRFVEGTLLERSPEPEIARRYGRLVARMHGLTDSWLTTSSSAAARPPLDAALLVDRSLDQIATFLGNRPADLDMLRRAASLLRRRMAALPLEPPGYGLVHGDVIPTNVLAAPDGSLTLLDFDFCGPGWRAFDVATYLHVVQEQRSPESNGRAFLAGYQDVRPLADWELAAIPLFVAVRELFRLGNWGWRVDEWGTSALPDDTVERHLVGIRDDLARLC
jgi:Ser/Thr protein kinase RdoA (MazF antagonist)